MNITIKKFDTLTALSAFIENTPANGYFKGRKLSSVSGSEDFTGTKNFATANNLLLYGWSEGAKRVKTIMAKNVKAVAVHPRAHYSVTGFAPCVARCLAGHPLNMINKKNVKAPARVVDIVYNCSVSGNVDASDIENNAAKLFNVIVSLERSGVRVNLWCVDISHADHKNYFSTIVKVKDAGQPFSLLKTIYPVVHPSFLRRHVFAVTERANLSPSVDWFGYGRPVRDKEKTRNIISSAGIKTENIFDFHDLRNKNEEEILTTIK